MANKQLAILIFDIGKTNKKVLLFDEQYSVIYEESTQLDETKDEDNFPCEDVQALTSWVQEKFSEILQRSDVEVKAVNFSAYGASFVHLDEQSKPITPLYNYLKPFPSALQQKFYNTYGGETFITKQTASPVLGSLNSGLQLYRLKYEQPEIFKQVKYSLHLPQYLSCIITKKFASDITSIGCHTHLWDFNKNDYHDWVYNEEINAKLPPLYNSKEEVNIKHNDRKITAGIGLHDSSAALIPYLKTFTEPFVLLSTGTWCISLNPFNHTLITDYELHNDCLCYLSYEGKPVKASRLFAGYEHEQQTKRLAAHFSKAHDYYKTIKYDVERIKKLKSSKTKKKSDKALATIQQSEFSNRDLDDYTTYEDAYYQFILDVMQQQVISTKIVLNNTPVKKIFVDGGFGKNEIYMNLLATAFNDIEVFAAEIPQASALGAALALHEHWNKKPLPNSLIKLTSYS